VSNIKNYYIYHKLYSRILNKIQLYRAEEMISRYIKRLNSLVYQLIFIYVIITVAAMCFSCRYSSLVSPSSSRRHGLFPRRAHAIYRSLAFRAGPVHQPLAGIMTVRGMRRIQASKSAALRCLVIGPSFFGPSKYTVGYKRRRSCCCRCSAKDLISDPWIPRTFT